MKILFLPASAGLVLACIASIPVGAQQSGFASNVESHAINPSLSLGQEIPLPVLEAILAALVGFYFGARS